MEIQVHFHYIVSKYIFTRGISESESEYFLAQYKFTRKFVNSAL